MREHPPAAVVIDLSRLPSHGRAVAFSLRQSKAARVIPLLFVDGAPEKLDRVKHDFPDAAYTTWNDIADDVRRGQVVQ